MVHRRATPFALVAMPETSYGLEAWYGRVLRLAGLAPGPALARRVHDVHQSRYSRSLGEGEGRGLRAEDKGEGGGWRVEGGG